MNFIGKIIGALVGLFVFRGQPLGIVLGVAIGHMFDVQVGQFRGSRPQARSFIEPLFALAGALCKSDGYVSQREIDATEALMSRLQLDSAQRQHAIGRFTLGKQTGFDVQESIVELRQWCRGRRDLAFLLIDMLLDIIYAEGPLAAAKVLLLRRLCQQLNVSEQELAAISAMKGYAYGSAGGGRYGPYRQQRDYAEQQRQVPPQRAPDAPDPYAALGLSRDADLRTVKQAYRKLMSQYHPDKLGDVPAEMKRRSELRATEINAAYEKIKHERGIK